MLNLDEDLDSITSTNRKSKPLKKVDPFGSNMVILGHKLKKKRNNRNAKAGNSKKN